MSTTDMFFIIFFFNGGSYPVFNEKFYSVKKCTNNIMAILPQQTSQLI